MFGIDGKGLMMRKVNLNDGKLREAGMKNVKLKESKQEQVPMSASGERGGEEREREI